MMPDPGRQNWGADRVSALDSQHNGCRPKRETTDLDAVLLRGRLEEVKDLLVGDNGPLNQAKSEGVGQFLPAKRPSCCYKRTLRSLSAPSKATQESRRGVGREAGE